ncbi:hypothetical protein JCM11251_002786 [Rhodosporidiobolus azoricus]
MPLKLLQHKSWHVYSGENQARVKRDEALAQAKEEEDDERARKIEAEARVERMRKKAKRRRGEGEGEDEEAEREREMERQLKGRRKEDRAKEAGEAGVRAEIVRPEKGTGKEREKEGSMTTNGHLNFWAELEAGTAAPTSSALAAAMKKSAAPNLNEDVTKVFLAKKGEGEAKGWYVDPEGRTEAERKESDEARLERAYKDTTLKRLTDPLALMNTYLSHRSSILSGSSLPSARPRQPSHRDRYIEPSSSASNYGGDTPRSERAEEIVPRLLPPPRRRGDPVPAPPPSPPRTYHSASSSRQSSSSTHVPRPSSSSSFTPNTTSLKAEASSRVSTERARATALLASRRRQSAASASASSVASSTPARSEAGGWGMYNREETRAAREARGERESGKGGGGGGGWREMKQRREGRDRDRYGGGSGRRDERTRDDKCGRERW